VSGSGISWAICKSAPRSRQDNHASIPTTLFLQPFLPPNQQRQSTEGTISSHGWQFQISEAETVQLMTTEFPDDHAEDHGSPVTTRSPAMTTILKFKDLQFVSGVASTKNHLGLSLCTHGVQSSDKQNHCLK